MDKERILYWLHVLFIASLLTILLVPLPRLKESALGHAIGIVGAVFILLTLIYPFRKRVLGQTGEENPLGAHMIFGLVGGIFVVFHSGGYFGGLTVSLAFISLTVVVFSGITGRFLYIRASRTLREYEQEVSSLRESFRERKEAMAARDLRSYFRDDSDGELEPAARRGCKELERLAESIADLEYTIEVYDDMKTLFGHWKALHVHLVFFLFALLGAHVTTILFYGVPWL